MPSNSAAAPGFLANPFARKLTLGLLFMAAPSLLLIYMFLAARNEPIRQVENELRGVEYMTPLRSVIENLQQHRSLTYAVLTGDQSSRGRLDQVQSAMDRQIQALEGADSRFGSELGTADKLGQLKRNWSDLRQSALRSNLRDTLDQHNRVIGEANDFLRYVGDKSHLTLDPDVDAFYLIFAAVNDLPVITDRIHRLGYLTNAALASKTPQDRLQVQVLAENVDTLIQSLQRNLNVATSANSGLQGRIALSAGSGADSWLRSLREGNIERFAATGGLSDASQAAGSFYGLYDSVLTSMRPLLESRASTLKTQRTIALGFAVVALLIAFALASAMHRTIIGEVRTVASACSHIAAGNYEIRVPVASGGDLGSIANSFNTVLDDTSALVDMRDERNRIQGSIQKLLDDISGVATGDLTQEAEVTAEVTGAIADSFNYMIGELRQIVRNVTHTTSDVGSSAQNVLKTAESLAQNSLGQVRQLTEASSSIDHMARSIREVSSTAGQAASVAEQTFQKAKQGSEAVQKTIQGMGGIRNQVQETSKRLKGLGERSQEIGSIVQLIGDIADRTSILALNASIQAAMAGEAGRGFAVVAEEVERLAERAAEATKKVNTLIKSIQADTSEAITAMEETTREVVDGSNLANAAGRTLSEIESVTAQLTNLIHSISTASGEQAQGSEYISKSMFDLSAHTQATAAGAKQAADSVQHLAELTSDLRRSMQRFRLPADEPSYTR
ncbi:MAG: HAMP domain-containing protein [Bryobacterales bacterium]|nr:HAMP domain-containing protein [Bryobacterales bacterium]